METCKSPSQTQVQHYPEARPTPGGYLHGNLSLEVTSGRHAYNVAHETGSLEMRRNNFAR